MRAHELSKRDLSRLHRLGVATAAALILLIAAAGELPSLGLRVPAARAAALPAQEGPKPARAAISELQWLAGNWAGEQGNATIEERWAPPSGGAMLAVARTVAGGRMTAFEFLRVVERDGGLVYVAQPNGRPPVEFVLTEVAARLAVFENPAHDFPQTIRYSLEQDGTLEALIGARGRPPVAFRFKRADVGR